MAKEKDGQTFRDYENRKKRYKRRKVFIVCTLLLTIVVVGSIYIMRLYNRSYHSYEVMNSEPNTGESAVGYLDYGNAVVKYSRDGAVAIDKNNKLLWNGSYEMIDPIAATRGKYVVIADRGNKSVHIFNEKGAYGSITTLNNIIKVEVSLRGIVAVMTEQGETNYFRLFRADGTALYESNIDDIIAEKATNVNDAGYPLDMALSEDGKKLAISFLKVTTGKLESTIAFFNFGEVGQNLTDRFAGSYGYEDILIPRIIFLNNDTVCAYRENGFMLIEMLELPEIIADQLFDHKIQSVFHNKKYTGFVIDGEEEKDSRLLLYNLSGEKLLDKEIRFRYDKIFIAGEDIILHDNLSCLIIRTDGREKFRYTFDSNIAALYPINNLDRYLFISETEISEIMLKE